MKPMKKIGPMDVHRKIAGSIEKYGNPFGESQKDRASWAADLGEFPAKAEIVYFTGCTASFRTPELAVNTVKIMRHAGVDFTILGEREVCCGSNLLRTGQTGFVEDLVRKNIDAIRKIGAKAVVTSCSGCFKTFSLDYPQIAGDLGFDVVHISQFLDQLLREGRIKVKGLEEVVTYHDPCHMGRHVGVFDEPRRVIESIPGLKLKEMVHIKENSRCCGAGGGVKAGFSDLALSIATKRVEEAASTGADTLVSCCPFCKFNLQDAVDQEKKTIKVKDLTGLVCEAAGI